MLDESAKVGDCSHASWLFELRCCLHSFVRFDFLRF